MKYRLFALVLPFALAAPAVAAPAPTAAPAPLTKAVSGDWNANIEFRGRHGSVGATFGNRRSTCPPVQSARGHYEYVTERVWVEGARRKIWVPAEYGYVHEPCGRRRRIVVRAGYYRIVQDPGYYETRTRRVWVPYRPAVTPGRGRHVRQSRHTHREHRTQRGRRFLRR